MPLHIQTDRDFIRAASSKWLRDNEAPALDALSSRLPNETNTAVLKRKLRWSDWQASNMLTFLDLVGE